MNRRMFLALFLLAGCVPGRNNERRRKPRHKPTRRR